MPAKPLQSAQTQQDKAERDALAAKYLPLVRTVAGRLAVALPPHVDADDLLSYGLFGLLDALDRFDESRGVRFETYASARIRGAIIDGLRSEQWAPAQYRKHRELERTHGELETRLGRPPTDAELAAALNITAQEVDRRRHAAAALTVISLDEHLPGEDSPGVRLVDRLVDTGSPDPETAAEASEARAELARAIETLADKERLVVTLYYYEGLTAREIASIMGLTPARISQLHARALLRLRGRLSRLRLRQR